MYALVAGLPGGMEWVILLVVALLLFGGSRLAGIGKGTGRAIREFKEETQGLRDADKNKAVTTGTGSTAADVQRTENAAAADVQRVEKNVENS